MNAVEILTDATELAPLRKDWSRLLSVTPHASFFQSADWLEMRWKHRLTTDADLQLAVIRENGVVTGIVPLCIQKKTTPLGDIRKLRFPIDNWGSFYGAVGANPEAAMSRVAAFFNSAKSGQTATFDLLEFTNLPDYRAKNDEPSESPEPNLSEDSGNWITGECSHVAMLYLEGDWNSYWESRRAQKNRRRNVERCERRLSELGELEYLRFRPSPGEGPRWDLYDACETLASKSWQDGLVDGNTLHHEDVRPFLRDVHLAAVQSGHCDLNLLTLDQKPIAFSYGYHFQGYVDLMKIGFDPDLAKFAPGNALWTRLIQDSYERGDAVLDFGPSCLDYKKFWMTFLETSYQSVHYSKTPAGKAFQLARTFKAKLPMKSADHTNEEAKELAAKKSRRPATA